MPPIDVAILRQVSGVGTATIGALRQSGYRTLNDLDGITLDQLTEVPGIGAATAEAILAFLASPAVNDPVRTYTHGEKRKNIPPAGMAGQGKVQELPQTRYSYDPHLPPVLRFDDTGGADALPPLIEEATQRPLTEEEAAMLTEALRNHQPWLEWSGKREQRWFDVDPTALHIHERVSAQAIIKLAERKPLQPSLFADPELDYREAVQFYQHDMDWANRLILGDSLTVMHSLARREDLAGKVQMIYMDPPYGIKFSSNFQPFVGKRDVKDRDADLTREPEQVKAYRDTWTLGVHSYLAYLRDRFIVAKELLNDSGSIFVQISDENLHRVRMLLDEVFGPENFVSIITYATTSGFQSADLSRGGDYILWYGKRREAGIKFHPLYEEQDRVPGEGGYRWIMTPDGMSRGLTVEEIRGGQDFPDGARLYKPDNILSQGGSSQDQRFAYQGKAYSPGVNSHWKANYPEGMNRLAFSGRIHVARNSVQYVRFADDFSVKLRNNIWTDTLTGQFTEAKMYVVQTNTKIIERCLLMTTDPGDLVLDPTCGSGTTAYVAEQWGRRWITIDTSRVALALARQRLITAQYDYYELDDPVEGIAGGLSYRTAPHIMLGGIANNTALDQVAAKWEPILDGRLNNLNAALQPVTRETRSNLRAKLQAKVRTEGKRAVTDADRRRWRLPQPDRGWQHWEVPFDTDPDWPEALKRALEDYRAAWRSKMDEVNATIAASAPSEVLVDQPKVVRNVLRVSGPFTVEGVQPAEETLDLESPIGGAPDELATFAADEPANAEAYLETMVRLLHKDGVRFPDNKTVAFTKLEPIANSILHAEGTWEMGGERRRVAVSFGPQYGPITAKQVEDCLWAASRAGYDDLVFAGFTIDGAAQGVIQDDPNPRVRCHLAHIRPDVQMGDLLKDTPGSQLFTVFGLPRVRLETTDEGEYVVEMEGVDVYDPLTNTLRETRAGKVAAWFLDSDYNGQTFCITQAFFPDSSAWAKLARALKSTVDPERFAAFSGTRSLPFEPGPHRRVAVKVIDPRGNEVMRVLRLGGVGY